MDRIELTKILGKQPERIKRVKLEKYENEPFAESSYRIQLDGKDTKFCWCSVCETYFSADNNHTLGNIRFLLISVYTDFAGRFPIMAETLKIIRRVTQPWKENLVPLRSFSILSETGCFVPLY